MSVTTQTVNNALVYYDATTTHRWYDAFGPSVYKYLTEFVSMPVDDSTGDPLDWVTTMTEAGAGVTTVRLTDSAGGALLITNAGNEDDGVQMQLGGGEGALPGGGEGVLLDGDYACYFGCMLQISEATQSDLLVGLCVTDTDPLGAVTDGAYFRKVDGSTTLNFITENTNSEGSTTAQTMVAATDYILEFYFDGRTITPYVDGTALTGTARSASTFPLDQELRVSLSYLNGSAGAKTCQVSWIRLIHLRG